MERWISRIALVTGASSGIGAAVVKELVRKGLKVVGIARRLNRMKEIENEFINMSPKVTGSFHPLKCDLTVESEIISAFDWTKKNLGGVDIVINSAGILNSSIRLIEGSATEDIKKLFDIHVIAMYICTREGIKSLRERGLDDGHFINISSVSGHLIPFSPSYNLNMYPASKAAVRSYSECLRQEFIRDQLKMKITTISPGTVETEIFEKGGTSEMQFDISLKPIDVANAVVYALSTPPNVQVESIVLRPMFEQF